MRPLFHSLSPTCPDTEASNNADRQLQQKMSSTSSLWRLHTSETTGQPYWFNTSTKESTYTDPSTSRGKVRLEPPPTGTRPLGWKEAAAAAGASSQAWFDAVEVAAFEAAMEEEEERDGTTAPCLAVPCIAVPLLPVSSRHGTRMLFLLPC